MKRVLVVASLLVASSSAAAAQACLGQVSFRNGAARVGGGYSEHTYTGEVGYGSPSSGFAAVRLDAFRRDVSAFEASANRGVISAGMQMMVGASRVQVCPVAAFGLISGSSHFTGSQFSPAFESEFDGRRYEIGGAIGYAPVNDDAWHVTPSMAVRFIRETSSGTSTTAGAVGQRGTYSYQFGLTTASLGVMRNGFGIRPFLQRAFAVRSGTTIQWGVGASYNFGRRP
jgi:hypothetical protein